MYVSHRVPAMFANKVVRAALRVLDREEAALHEVLAPMSKRQSTTSVRIFLLTRYLQI